MVDVKLKPWQYECRMETPFNEKWLVYWGNKSFNVADGEQAKYLWMYLNVAEAQGKELTQTQQALDIAKEALIYVNNRIFDLETGRIDLRENEYLTDSIRKIKTALKVIEGKV